MFRLLAKNARSCSLKQEKLQLTLSALPSSTASPSPPSRSTSTSSSSKQTAANAAAKEAPKLLEIFIDEKKIHVEPGTTILEAASLAGVEIPRFCYHERLSVAGNCRMCLVEVERSVKPVASCAMPVTMPGMRVKTNSPMAKQAREGVMEFLLMNHPLDCPICDQGGECDLQDQSMQFGSDRSRLQATLDPKRAVEDKNIGPLVKTIMTRCIHCTRCVRFMNEVAGCESLGTTGRGSQMQIGTYLENTLLASELSGNIVDLCPVGALTSKPYAFTARPWELRRIDSVDVMDAVGSNIAVCTRAGNLMRILPRENDVVNEEWLADKARHAPIDGLKCQRLNVPMLKPSRTSTLQQCDWEDALLMVARVLNDVSPARAEAVVGPFVDAETMVAVKDLFNMLGSENLFVHVDSDLDASALPSSQDLDIRANYLFNSTIDGLESNGVDCVLLVGTNPRFEAPLVNSRLRKAWRNNSINSIAVIGERDLDLLYDYEYLGDSTNVLNDLLSGKHPFATQLKNAARPALILGQQILDAGQPSNVYQLAKAVCAKYAAEFNLLHCTASQVAAFDLGFRPSTERTTSNGDQPSLLWLFGVDDSKLQSSSNCFVVYQGHTGDICANLADVILPGAAFTEKQGTMVNMEGRVQQTMAAITPPNMAREDWKIVRALSEVANLTLPYDTLIELRERMSEHAPHLLRVNNRSLQKTLSSALKIDTAHASPVAADGRVKILPKLKTLTDYYQTDAISRSSATMSKCIQAVRGDQEKRRSEHRN